MESKDIILGSAYLAPVSYFAALYSCRKAYIERYDHYMKQTYRNRCVIASADGPLALTIPVEKSAEGKCAMKDIRVSEHGNWRHVHRNAFVAAYKQSPFFDYYADEFNAFFDRKYEFLYDFNMELTQWLCEQIDIQPELVPTTEYMDDGEGIIDLREAIHPKKSAEDSNSFCRPLPYYQVFDSRHGFLPDLSIVDLLFNMGPESLLVLRDCVKQ
ncbi:WbqC family protein [Bacteroides caecigallinarum]|uniref:WbqC family protein n=1 Tax=Bacteroides caecigallinarum TaxID=1411144 RepID=UPI001F45A000|nr:WbqC family protein [Bacteroides caecigallinarum]MCF2593353.1 WbqC family protein [Bacteroides caecigallinarum]